MVSPEQYFGSLPVKKQSYEFHSTRKNILLKWFGLHFGMIRGWFWTDLGMILGWSVDDLGMILTWFWIGFGIDLGLIWGRFWNGWNDFGLVLEWCWLYLKNCFGRWPVIMDLARLLLIKNHLNKWILLFGWKSFN